jgi:hypothetical protein
MPKVNTRADSLSHVNDASAWKKTWKPSICELSIRFCKNCKCHARMPRTSTTPNDSLMSNERWVYLARTVNMHRNIRSVYDHIFCNFPANNTVYTPYIYGSGQPYTWHELAIVLLSRGGGVEQIRLTQCQKKKCQKLARNSARNSWRQRCSTN